MAEPLSAIGLASGILQFADFGVKFVRTSIKIYRSKSGATKEHDELDIIAKDLEQHIVTITSALSSDRDVIPKAILDSCRKLSSDMQQVLASLRATSGRRSFTASVITSAKVILKQHELDDLQRRLIRMRDTVSAHLSSIVVYVDSLAPFRPKYFRSET